MIVSVFLIQLVSEINEKEAGKSNSDKIKLSDLNKNLLMFLTEMLKQIITLNICCLCIC